MASRLLFCIAFACLACVSRATTRVPVRTPVVLIEQDKDADDIIVIDNVHESGTIKLESAATPTAKTHSTTRHPYKQQQTGVPLTFDTGEREASAWFAQYQAAMRSAVSPGKLVMIMCGVTIALFYAVGEMRKIYRARRLLRRASRAASPPPKGRTRDRKKLQ